VRLRITPEGRFTGNHHVLIEKRLLSRDVSLNEDNEIELKMKVGPITTSGRFNGRLTMKISEFYQILGAVEEYKLGKLSDLTTDDE